jgi:hypothetical protein
MMPCGSCRTDVLEERASIIRVERISELAYSFYREDEAIQGVTSQRMAFFIVTAVKTSNLTQD